MSGAGRGLRRRALARPPSPIGGGLGPIRRPCPRPPRSLSGVRNRKEASGLRRRGRAAAGRGAPEWRPSPEPAPPAWRCRSSSRSRRRRGRGRPGRAEKASAREPAMALDFLAGCVGGAAGVMVGHPFDTVKVRLQVQNIKKPLYRGTFHCFQSIIKQESALGLYKGIGSPMMGLTFINALVFGVQGNTIRALRNDTPLNQFLAGSAAGAIQCVICCPMELAKTRMQLQGTGEYRLKSKNYKNSLDCLVKIYRKEGLKGINRGMLSTFLRETPSFGFYFLTYDYLTRYLGCEAEDSYIIPKLLLAGGMSGIVSWLSTYPVDVIKSRLQADGVGGVVQYKGILDCVQKSYHSEGWRVFTRGLTSTLLRAFPVNAATFATVTVFLMYMRSEDRQLRGDLSGCEAGPAIQQPSSF
ncbi:mitochondrial basic amino acids transporter isoform X1 [Paroedura picta]|uniref:mitochondrial basic amino acids transporter isoform X1 n=2 Tax=Paroedura picta TaxID=143630 RepID=UPI0040559DF2